MRPPVWWPACQPPQRVRAGQLARLEPPGGQASAGAGLAYDVVDHRAAGRLWTCSSTGASAARRLVRRQLQQAGRSVSAIRLVSCCACPGLLHSVRGGHAQQIATACCQHGPLGGSRPPAAGQPASPSPLTWRHHLQRLRLALLGALHPLGHLQPARLESSMRRTGSCQLHRRQMHTGALAWKLSAQPAALCMRMFQPLALAQQPEPLTAIAPEQPQPPGPCCPSPPSDHLSQAAALRPALAMRLATTALACVPAVHRGSTGAGPGCSCSEGWVAGSSGGIQSGRCQQAVRLRLFDCCRGTGRQAGQAPRTYLSRCSNAMAVPLKPCRGRPLGPTACSIR